MKISNVEAEFWQLEDPILLQLDQLGINSVKFVDFTHLLFSDANLKDEFQSYAFMSGKFMQFNGEMHITHLPEDFNLNLFKNMGLMATIDIAHTFQELAGAQVQLFPVRYKEDAQRFFYINITKIFDCVDYKRSGAEYNDKGKPYAIKQLVLKKENVDTDAQIFRTTFLRPRVIIRNSLRIKLLNRHEIRGCKFVPLAYS